MDADTDNNNNNNDREESKIITAYQRTTPGRLKFMVQSLIAVIIIVFSVTQITVNPDHDNNIWVGLICTILGLFFPHPTPQVADVITGGGGGTASDDNAATTAPDTGGAVIKSTTHTRSRPSPRVHAHRLSQRLNKNDHKSKKDNNIVTD